MIDFPLLNASLNGSAGVLLILGYIAIRRRNIALHKTCMLAAMVTSAIFLSCYLYYHLVIQQGKPTHFADRAPEAPPWVGTLYLVILGSHTILAAVVTPMALLTAYRGLRDRLADHVRLARWTLPIWLYVSITGVVVYWMLYRLYPDG
jgi:protein SCO1/2/putative membrane protein